MDINDLRGLSTLFMMVAFFGVVGWAWSKKRKKSFDEAANLPFADEAPKHQGEGGEEHEEGRND